MMAKSVMMGNLIFSYETPQVVHIRSRLGILYRVVQLAIISYIIVYVLIINKGYQSFDRASISCSTTKVKGVGLTDIPKRPVWDAADLLIPSQSNGGFFLGTNLVITENQTQRRCPEHVDVTGSRCLTDADCLPIGKAYLLGHGVTTGYCNQTTTTCMIHSWCEIENDDARMEHLVNFTRAFTVFIRNHVHFPKFKVSKTNLFDLMSEGYLHTCLNDQVSDRYCPVFSVSDMVDMVSEDEALSEGIWTTGGVISIKIDWDCNLDYAGECTPKYSFERLDNSGYNIRQPMYYYNNGTTERKLIKAYGILFTIETHAEARKFDVINLLLNTGSGLGLLTISSLICDVILAYTHTNRAYYKGHIAQNMPKRRSPKLNQDQPQIFVIETSESSSNS